MGIVLQSKKMGKIVLRILQKVLPENTYREFYNQLHARYKNSALQLYKSKRILFFLTGNTRDYEMVDCIIEVLPYTLVGIGGLEATYRLAKALNDKEIAGNFVELGVAKGGCAALLAHVAFENEATSNRVVWLFDSFEGLPEPTEKDYVNKNTGDHVTPLIKGSCLGSLEEVQSLLFNHFNYPREKIVLVKGWFQDTLPRVSEKLGGIALLRIDGDWYESTKTCLEYLYDKVVQDGVIIIDDYLSCYGCKRAVDEFIENNSINAEISFDGRGGCFFFKS